jgi:very-short-patch-repair endonuclease
VDAVRCDHRVIGECDGAVKYDIDAAPTMLLAEKRRRELLEDLGYIVVRWDHADLTHHAAATKQRILHAFSRSDLLRRIQPAS